LDAGSSIEDRCCKIKEVTLQNVENIARLGKKATDGQTLHNFAMTVFFLTEDKEQALEPLREAIEWDPSERRFQQGYVTACHSIGNYSDVLLLADHIGVDPFDEDLRECLVRGYQERDMDVEAISVWVDRARISKRSPLQKILSHYSQRFSRDAAAAFNFWKKVLERFPLEKDLQNLVWKAIVEQSADTEDPGYKAKILRELMKEYGISTFRTEDVRFRVTLCY
jgi:hypothetical protein